VDSHSSTVLKRGAHVHVKGVILSTSKNLFVTLFISVLSLGCDSEASHGPDMQTGTVPDMSDMLDMPEIIDDLPTVPEAGPTTGVIEFPEQIIPAGTDVQTCLYLAPLTEDLFLTTFSGFQGQNGHHLFLYRALAPREPGSLRDCSDEISMAELVPAVFSSNFAISGFPQGMAMRLERGTQLVVQQHYINTRTQPLRVRDVLHYEPLSRADVETEIGFLGLSDITFQAEAVAGIQAFEIECVVPFDMSLLMLGPHMHEWGDSIRLSLVDGDSEVDLLYVEDWEVAYRDYPPINDLTQQPLELVAGQQLKLRCRFENTTDDTLSFPNEMCAVYGYFFPVVERDTWLCSGL
jgi:hypothetical protein